MSLKRVIGVALLTLSFLAGCGGSGSVSGGGGGGGGADVGSDGGSSGSGGGSSGGGSGSSGSGSGSGSGSTELAVISDTSNPSEALTSEDAVLSGSADPSAASTALSSAVSVGETVGVSVGSDVTQGEVTAEIDQAPTDVVVDDGEAVVVVPDLPPGTHTLTLEVHGKKISFDVDVAASLPITGDARQYVADLIAEALRLLDEYLAAHPDDTAAADLRARLAAAQALLASMSDEELQSLIQQFIANPLPSADAPASCVAAAAGHEARLKAFLRTARLTSWLAAKHATHKKGATHVPVLLAQARMEEALRRLVAYTQAVMDSCGGDAALEQQTEAARGRHQRSARAVAALLR